MNNDTSTLISILILIGAGIMVVNIARFRNTISELKRFDLSPNRHLRLLGRLHQGLMAFFILGYVTVAYAILADITVISEFFVGLIFLTGSIFVWLGILLQHQMIAMIRSRYEQTYRAKADLEIERSKLKTTNRQLNSEVDERQRAESALRESEQHLKLIIEHLPAGVLIVDEVSKRIKEANPAATKVIGRPIQEVIGAERHRFVCPEKQGESPVSEQDGQMNNTRRTLINASGQKVPILQSACRIHLDGRPHLLESFIDISDKERLETQLRRAQKMEALGTLAGGVAHDLNNILSGIVSYPDLLLNDLPPDSPMRRPVNTIKKTGEKAATIVQDMLTLARRGVESKQVISLTHVIRDYLNGPEHKRLLLHHPDVTFSKHLAGDLLNIMGSSVHLFKTIMNLSSNAAEAMPEGGTVVIKAENRYVDRPLKGYDTVEEGDYVVLSVSDTGIGIAEEDHDRIFEPFYTKKELGRSGTGLGMAVVWGTVRDHLGYVNIESEISRGTTFSLYFPATREGIRKEQDQDDIRQYMGKEETILIVDDVAEQRQIATDILTMLNYAPHTVSGGEEALDYLQAHPMDLVLLDMIMDPGMSGLQTYQKILEINPGQRALLVSGYSETEDVRMALQIGAGQYVKKPYTIKTIGIAIRKELDR